MSTHIDDEAARDRVLDAASRLFYARGIQAVGMDALRAEAGVSLKRLYHLFPAKEAIVEQVLRRGHSTWVEWLSSTTADTPRDRLLAIYDVLARWFEQDDFRGCIFINSFGELGATEPRIADIVRAHKAWFQETVAGLVADAGAPSSLAHQLAILAEGAQTTAAISGSNESAKYARDAAETLIDHAISWAS
jgi:AcrR family transcriptional regulator